MKWFVARAGDQVLFTRVYVGLLIILAIALRINHWVLPYEIRVWGMWIAGVGLGYIYGARCRFTESWKQQQERQSKGQV